MAPERTRRALLLLAQLPDVQLALLTAASIDDVDHRLGNPRAYVVAAGGLLTRKEDGTRRRHAPEPPSIALRQELEHWCERFPGARFEDIGPAWTLHDRGIPDAQRPAFGAGLRRRLRAHPEVASVHRRHAFDVLPRIDWDRGRALEEWLERDGGPGATLLFIGADTDDEATHEQVRQRGGWTVAVGRLASRAEFGLGTISEVTWFLEWLGREWATRNGLDAVALEASLVGRNR